MALFGPSNRDLLEALAALRTEVASLTARVADQERAAESIHKDVMRWMKRAVEAERRAERNQEPTTPTSAGPSAPPALPARTLWGARARRAARLLRDDPTAELAHTNGTEEE